jgi:hypothetical protein
MLNSNGLIGVCELARQGFYEANLPITSQVNILHWIVQFSCLNGKNGHAEKFVKAKLEKDLPAL